MSGKYPDNEIYCKFVVWEGKGRGQLSKVCDEEMLERRSK